MKGKKITASIKVNQIITIVTGDLSKQKKQEVDGRLKKKPFQNKTWKDQRRPQTDQVAPVLVQISHTPMYNPGFLIASWGQLGI